MNDEDKTYDDLGSLTAADLFDAIWQEKKDDVTAERDTGEAYLNTVTAARTSIGSFRRQNFYSSMMTMR